MSAPANQGALNTFLSKFEIVSPTNMTFKNGLGSGGFQEQIVLTPEPRGGIWMLLGLLTVGFLATWRRGISFESSRNSGEQKLMCYVAY